MIYSMFPLEYMNKPKSERTNKDFYSEIYSEAKSNKGIQYLNLLQVIPQGWVFSGKIINLDRIYDVCHKDLFGSNHIEEWRLQDWCIGVLDDLGFYQSQSYEAFYEWTHEPCYFIHGIHPYNSKRYPGHPDLKVNLFGYEKDTLYIEFKSTIGLPSQKQRDVHKYLRKNNNAHVCIVRSVKEFFNEIGRYFFNDPDAFFDINVFQSWILYHRFYLSFDEYGNYCVNKNSHSKTYDVIQFSSELKPATLFA